ncbi:MAG: GerMN domain-containing protein [Bacilli bacterium]|nr:GerMN domain-containing protein [Bacilli bacterium]MDD3895707.1 GerMN domain-containing protein [Bacilli bacterium]MDD4407723.1 GerMN domain-containing protein [Bacilli bacterium]
MLKKNLIKKTFLILSCLFILFILYLFPKKDNNKIKNEKDNQIPQVSIYLIDNNDYVSRVNVAINKKEITEKIREIIAYLTINSKISSYIKEGFTPIIPEGTKLLSIDIDNNLVKLNFSKEFYNISKENEEKMISAIVYSLTGLPNINKVSIYVEDIILNELPHSKIKLPPTLDRGYGINKYYDVTNFKGTVSTTIYYLNKYKDYYYYIPVTMVNNQNKDKIEIIINELTSKAMYQTNLISYLNDAKQISYEITDEYLLIKLSDELYHDLNSSNLIESVIYSINLSIKENYDIKTVMYMTNNLTIGTYFL